MENFAPIISLVFRLLIALSLYGFLAWGLLTIWRDLKHQASRAVQQHLPVLEVSLAASQGGQETLRFGTDEVTIGRHPSCEWMIADDTVSSRHARLRFQQDHWWLEDLGSRNGTFLNGEQLTAPAVLAEADQVRCGQVSFTIGFEDGTQGDDER
jgi:pSer/pThr/pTyr-binding forkhead associated (FHA) protein